jgi:hypothetical protein
VQNDNDFYWGVNFRPIAPVAEKNWDGVCFAVIDLNTNNASDSTIKMMDAWSNSGLLPVLNTSGAGYD